MSKAHSAESEERKESERMVVELGRGRREQYARLTARGCVGNGGWVEEKIRS